MMPDAMLLGSCLAAALSVMAGAAMCFVRARQAFQARQYDEGILLAAAGAMLLAISWAAAMVPFLGSYSN